MRLAILLFAVALTAYAAESKHDKDVRECNAKGEAAGNEAVKTMPMQSPADVTFIKQKAKQTEVNRCMRAAGYASGPIRAK